MIAVPTTEIDFRDSHRLIPAKFADGGASVLAKLTDDLELLRGIFELDDATNDRLLAENDLASGIDRRELIFGIPQYRIVNAAFCHPAPTGSRFNSADRGAWYAGREVETSEAEIVYHKQLSLQEIDWKAEEVVDYVDYLADFQAEFHDIRGREEFSDCLSPTSYAHSQVLAAELLAAGSAGIVYPSVRREGGVCLACFRPVLVTHVRRGNTITFVFSDGKHRVL